MKPSFVALIIVALALGLVSAVSVNAQSGTDAVDVVGNWEGTYSSAIAGTDKIYLAITKVENQAVSGTIHIRGNFSGANRDLPLLNGKIGSNVLTFGDPNGGSYRLTVAGTKMSGTASGRATTTLELTRK